MPHTNIRGGSLIVDKVFPKPVGRICRASGTTDAKLLAKYLVMLDDLWDDGRTDLLQAIRRGARARGLSIPQVYAAWKRKNLAALPSAESMAPLAEAWTAWMAQHPVGDAHRDQLGRTLQRLKDVADTTFGARVAAVADLPALVAALRASRLAAGFSRAFQYERTNAITFARRYLGRSHPITLAVQDVERLPKGLQRPKQPLTAAELDRVGVAMLRQPLRGMFSDRPEEADRRSREAVALVWTMAATGMGPKELYGAWALHEDRVVVQGTKRASRDRIVPRVLDLADYATPTTITRKALEQRWEKATAATIGRRTLYDLRRTFAVWMDDAGIATSRQDAYLGHGPQTMTDLYKQRMVSSLVPHLTADARAIRGRIDAERAARPLTLVSESGAP